MTLHCSHHVTTLSASSPPHRRTPKINRQQLTTIFVLRSRCASGSFIVQQSANRKQMTLTVKRKNNDVIIANMAAARWSYTLVSRCHRRRRCQFITYLVADRIEIAQARHCACVPARSIMWFWTRPVNCVHRRSSPATRDARSYEGRTSTSS